MLPPTPRDGAALLAEIGKDRRSAGRALAQRHSWDAAAAAHLSHYVTLGAGEVKGTGGADVRNLFFEPRFVTQ